MSSQSFKDRMEAKLKARGNVSRSDIELHTASIVDNGQAVRLIATFAPVFGTPNVHDVREWVRSGMGIYANSVDLHSETLRMNVEGEAPFFTAILQQRRDRAPIASAERMVKAGIDQYIDTAQQLWEVCKASDGSEYLVRHEGTSMEEMLAARHAHLSGGDVRTSRDKLSASMGALGGTASSSAGDTVDFYHDGAILRGEIISKTASGVKVRATAGGETFTIDPGALIAVVERGAQDLKAQDDVVRKFWGQVYPGNPEMTEEISPLSNLPIRGPTEAGGEKIEPISVVASVGRVSGTVQSPFGKASK